MRQLVLRAKLLRRIGALSDEKQAEARRALRFAVGCCIELVEASRGPARPFRVQKAP